MKLTLKNILLLFCAFVLHQSMDARDTVKLERNNFIAVSMHNSYLACHYHELSHLADFYHGVDIRYFYNTNGDKLWHWAYGFPKIGAGLNLGQYHHPGIGKLVAGYVFATFPVYEFNRFMLNWDLCTGMGWVENIYDPVDNPHNIGVSLHWNAFIDINVNTTFPITDRLSGLVTLGVSHYSNGSTKKPNKGLNMFGLRTGVVYRLEEEIAPKSTKGRNTTINRKWGMDVRYGVGHLGISGHDEPYRAENYQLFMLKRVSTKFRMGFGVDMIKDESLVSKQYLLDGNHSDQIGFTTRKLEGQKVSLYQGGVMYSNEFIMQRFSFVAKLGYLVLYNYDIPPVYERFTLRYRILDGFFADVSLRAQGNKAKDITWGIGYSLNRGKN